MSITPERRRAVVRYLTFIRDFNQLDVTKLITQAEADDIFVEAVEAVLLTAAENTLWAKIDLLRDFCIVHMLDTPPTARPIGRLSPFSLSLDMLQALLVGLNLDLQRMTTLHIEETSTRTLYLQTNQRELWVTTNMQAVITKDSTWKDGVQQITVGQLGSQRIILSGASLERMQSPIPLLCVFPPNDGLRITQQGNTEFTYTVEGWRIWL